MTPAAPTWFNDALAATRTEGEVLVAGTAIHYLEWGDRAKPVILFVHGGSAHAHWWTHLAPMFIEQYHPVAIDMSGHGDSGRRDAYAFDIWAEEILAVCEATGMDTPPVLVGHSMGGLISIVTASLHGERLRGVIIVDSPVRRPDPERVEGVRGRAFRNPKTYDDLETALSHFRLVPSQPPGPDYVMDYIARQSLVQGEAGWTWKFDPNIFLRQKPAAIHEFLSDIQTRVALFRGELSDLVTPDVSDYMYHLLGRNAPVVAIPQAYHHLILDQPLAFVAALRAILADWDHTVPRRRG